jgi:hypothetical protein
LLPLLVRHLVDLVWHKDTGVVDEHVNAAQDSRRLIDHHPDRVSVPQVGLDHNVTRTGQRRQERARGIPAGAAVNCHRITELRKRPADRRADPT